MYDVTYSKRYSRAIKLMMKRGRNMAKINAVIKLLSSSDEPLPSKYRDHSLSGNFKDYRECHIENDWILIYRKYKNELILVLSHTGTHSDMF